MSGIDFGNDNSSRYYTISDATNLTIPDGDWTIGVRVRIQDNSGSKFQYILSTGDFGSAGAFQLFLHEDDNTGGDFASSWGFQIVDDSANEINVREENDPDALGEDDTERLIIAQRSGDTLYLKTCPNNGTVTTISTSDASGMGQSDGGDLHYGNRADNDPDRFFEEHAGQFFFVKAALSDAQIEDLAALQGLEDAGVDAGDIVFDLQPTGPDATLTDQSGNGHDATQNGSGWPAASTFDLNPASDTTAPTVTSPTSANVAQTSADVGATSNEGGTGYMVILPSGASAPTGSQVVAGTDGNEDPAVDSGQTAATADTAFTIGATGLSAGTTYDYYVTAEDSAGNVQQTPVSGSFTTATQSISTTITDKSDNPLPDLTDITWWFYDDPSNAPVDEGTGATTDGSGEMQIGTPNAAGTQGYLLVQLSDGRVCTSLETPS